VPVGGYAIDFVVEGADDRRLAIELDGDKYHGPDRWADDMRRQRALERLGWTFWRCWGSTWISDREGCVADLVKSLERVGVEPIGMAEIDGVHTEHIEVPNPAARHEAAVEEPDLAKPVAEEAARRPGLEERIDRALATIAASSAEASPELRFGEPTPVISTEETTTPSETVFADLESVVVEVGDLVFIRYDDQPERTFTVRLSDTINNPNEGVLHADRAPLGAAILGASLDEQITVKIGDRTRTAVIEKIEKAREALIAAE
jgi:transcription elongation GreA/GreB family factor